MEEAEKNVNKALSLDAEDALCLYLKGYLCFQQNKFDGALDALSMSAKLLPEEARTHTCSGSAAAKRGAGTGRNGFAESHSIDAGILRGPLHAGADLFGTEAAVEGTGPVALSESDAARLPG